MPKVETQFYVCKNIHSSSVLGVSANILLTREPFKILEYRVCMKECKPSVKVCKL
jgi:hypothetical protein